MDFAVTGTINSYVKTKNLTFAAKYKIRTGQTLTNSNGNFISLNTSTFDKLREAAKASSDKAKQAKLRRIKQKLMNGRKLSDEEMGFLRVNDTKLYKKAKHAEEAREELKAELKKAESKSEAREAMTRAMIKASTEAIAELGALGQCGGISGGGSAGDDSISFGGECSENFSGSSANVAQSQTSAENISGTENQTFNEVNQSIQNSGDDKADKNFGTQKNSDDDKNTPEDIMEKFIMTIRALEDEWANFTKSDEYKNLPENISDDDNKKIHKQITVPNGKFLKAVAVYRNSMLYKLA